MTTIRVKKDARYFTASNEPFNDKQLSWEARGLMGYLLSKPNDWQVNQKDIEKQGTAGREKVRRMLAELRKYGYMNRIRITVEHNKFDWITEVYESPSQNPSITSGFIKSQYTAFQSLAKPHTGKAVDIVSTESLSTKKLNEDDVLAKISKAYESEIGILTPMIADELMEASTAYPLKWTLDAMRESATQNKRGWKYVLAILSRWKAQGNQEPMKPQGNKNYKPRDLIQERYGGIMEWAMEAKNNDDTTGNGGNHGKIGGGVPQLETG